MQVDPKFLTWEYRRPLIVQRLLDSKADIICVEEMNHFGKSTRARLPCGLIVCSILRLFRPFAGVVGVPVLCHCTVVAATLA